MERKACINVNVQLFFNNILVKEDSAPKVVLDFLIVRHFQQACKPLGDLADG